MHFLTSNRQTKYLFVFFFFAIVSREIYVFVDSSINYSELGRTFTERAAFAIFGMMINDVAKKPTSHIAKS